MTKHRDVTLSLIESEIKGFMPTRDEFDRYIEESEKKAHIPMLRMSRLKEK